MGLFSRKILLETSLPLYQACRFRGKINIQKPKLAHFDKAKYLEFTKPIYPSFKRGKAPHELCQKSVRLVNPKDVENPYQNALAREMYKWFTQSKLIAFYHMNSMSMDDQFKAFALFKKNDMHMKSYGKKTLEIAIKGTPYETVLDLYVSRNTIVFSHEAEIKKLMKVTKKFPQIIFLAGIYEGRFLTKDEIMRYSTIPNIQTAQSQLVQTLDGLGSTLVQQLNTHQTNLVDNLRQRMKQLEVN